MNCSVKTLRVAFVVSSSLTLTLRCYASEDFNKTLKERPVGDFNESMKHQVQVIDDGVVSHPYRTAPSNPSSNFDSSREMVIAWDRWHKEVANAIFERFNTAAQANFRHSQPLAAQVSYMVAKDGRIGNIRVLEHSDNQVYDTMLVSVIRSMAHNPILEYPAGSKRQFVEKSGRFTWNYPGGGDFPAAPLPAVGPGMVAK